MTSSDILHVLIAAGWKIMPRDLDAVYDPVDPKQVQDSWGDWVDGLPRQLKTWVPVGNTSMSMAVPRYIDLIFNCNKMSRAMYVALDVDLAVQTVKAGQTTRNAPAFGPMSYLIGGDPTKGHDIDFYIDSSNTVHYFEKQMGQDVTLTPVEVGSIFFAELP